MKHIIRIAVVFALMASMDAIATAQNVSLSLPMAAGCATAP